MKILITGSASGLAQATLPVLFANNNIEKIYGIDIAESPLSHPKYHHINGDMRSNPSNLDWSDIDALIHMAFVVNNGALGDKRFDRELIRAINVDGSKNIVLQAIEQQVKTIIHLSSGVVYGAAENGDLFARESQPLKKIPGFYYSEDKIDLELWLDDMEQQHPTIRIVRLRPHVILGENTQPLVRKLLTQPFYFTFKDPQPLTQCVWEGDVANAIEKSLFADVSGAFNLSSHEVTSFRFIQQHIHKFAIPAPYHLMRKFHQLLWKTSARYGDPSWLELMQYSITLDNDKARQELGWQPSLNLFDSLDATV